MPPSYPAHARDWLATLTAAVALAGVACGPAAQPTPQPAVPATTVAAAPTSGAPATAPAATSAPAAPVASAAPAAATAPAAPAAPSAPPAAAKPAAGEPGGPPPAGSNFPNPFAARPTVPVPAPSPVAAPSGGVVFTLVPADSEARFVARELLAANTIKTDAIGRTKAVAGQISLGPGGQVVAGSRIVVDLQPLASDSAQRDNFIKQSVLRTSQFPSVEFVPTEIQGLASPVPTSGQASFKIVGDLTVRGVTKPATWEATATFTSQDVSGTATTSVRLESFGMQKPQVPMVASIEDDIRLEIDFKATRAA